MVIYSYVHLIYRASEAENWKAISISIRNSTTTPSFFLLEFFKKSDHLMVLFHFFLCKDYNSYFSLISGKFVQNKITEKDHDQKKKNRILDVVRSQIHTNFENSWKFRSLKVILDLSSLLKLIYSEKASKFCEISTNYLYYLRTASQIIGGDFARFCSLLRLYEFT